MKKSYQNLYKDLFFGNIAARATKMSFGELEFRCFPMLCF